ncbi:acetyl-CoA carboxylase biotin carboxyl carrier protein subunit, partial [Rhodococcus sp. BS-15]|uniref:acetyl-CoA carboxylase biotin carboxyl carrier protein subunit n=1 Tax=Rhodococcus sp. BS-15 TaxID=1304954 RepID=UPI0011AE1A67
GDGIGDLQVDVERLGAYESRLVIGDHRYQVVTVAGAAHFLVEVDGISHQISQDEAGLVRAPAPAVVVAVPVAVGDEVEAGQTLVVLESMKMETAVRSPYAGTVREVLASVNGQVDAGAALLRVDQAGEQKVSEQAPRVQFRGIDDAAQRTPQRRALDRLDELAALITGFDVSGARARNLLSTYETLRADVPRNDSELVSAELSLLNTFADICELSRNRPTMDEESTDERVHSPREHFHSFLQSLDADVQGLPESFRAKLTRALAHYDAAIDEGRTPELEEAVYRVFLALQRMENQVPVIAALLGHWLSDCSAQPEATPAMAEVLERLIGATQARYPVIGDVARNLRFRLFDEPQIRSAREKIYDGVRGSLQYLAENPDAADYSARIQEVADVDEPLLDLLNEDVDPGVMLEVMTRQCYGIHQFENVAAFNRDDLEFVTGAFLLNGVRVHVAAVQTDRFVVHSALAAIDGIVESTPGIRVADVYLFWPDSPADGDDLSAELQRILEQSPVRAWRRVTFTVFGSGTPRQITLRPTGIGAVFAEDTIIRDMHPLTGQRLDLWRLKNFDGVRLPASAGTYLFHLTSKANPSDERLVALAEIRGVTTQLDDAGNIVAVPEIERTVAACLDGIRRAQAGRGKKRLDANRVVLYVWPVLNVPADRIATIARHIAPLTIGAGLEEITLIARLAETPGATPREVALRLSYRSGAGIVAKVTPPPTEPMRPLDEYTQKVQRSQARGTVYPYELIPLLSSNGGTFTEYDF